MPELAIIKDSFSSGPSNFGVTFDIEVGNGQIQMSFDRRDSGFNESMVALAFACGLDSMKDTQELIGIPFMIDRESSPIQLFQIVNKSENPLDRRAQLWAVELEGTGQMTNTEPSDAIERMKQLDVVEVLREARQFIVDACSLIDAIKVEWTQSGHWSEWDQSICDRAIANIHAIDATLNPKEPT